MNFTVLHIHTHINIYVYIHKIFSQNIYGKLTRNSRTKVSCTFVQLLLPSLQITIFETYIFKTKIELYFNLMIPISNLLKNKKK